MPLLKSFFLAFSTTFCTDKVKRLKMTSPGLVVFKCIKYYKNIFGVMKYFLSGVVVYQFLGLSTDCLAAARADNECVSNHHLIRVLSIGDHQQCERRQIRAGTEYQLSKYNLRWHTLGEALGSAAVCEMLVWASTSQHQLALVSLSQHQLALV